MRVKLTDICEFQGGSQPPKSEWNDIKLENYVRMLQIRDFTQGKQKYIQYVKDNKKLKKCNDSDILIGRYGASIGKILTGLEGAYNVALMKITPNDELNTNYLYQFLNSSSFQNTILSIGSRAAQAGFNKDDLSNIKIPLPPLTQQKTIAKTLDKAKELIELRKASIEKLDELSKSVFIDMFGDPVENPMGWDIFNLDKVSSKITDGEHGTVTRVESGKMYLMARNISKLGKLDLSIVSYISEESHNKIFKRCNSEYNDLLLVCVGATIGKCCLVPQMESFSLARSVALIKPSEDKVNSYFLLNFFRIESIQRELKRASNASAQAGLYTGMIKRINIILPPLDLQNKFAKTIQKIESQKALYEKELVKLEENFEALLAKSFG